MYVIESTIIPNMPKRPLEEPDDDKYHAKTIDLENQIEKLNEEIQEKKSQRKEKRDSMVDGQRGRNPIKEQLNELFNELRVYTD